MRYLKTYESFDSLKLEIEDILRELEDDGIRIDVQGWDGIHVFLTNTKEHKLGPYTAPDTFKYEVIKPNIEHLVSFLKDKGYKMKSIHNIKNLNSTGSRVQYPDLDGSEIGRLELRF